jgi:hypothetical protein
VLHVDQRVQLVQDGLVQERPDRLVRTFRVVCKLQNLF